MTSISELHEICQVLKPQPTKDVVAKVIRRLFGTEPSIIYEAGEKKIVYNNISINKEWTSSEFLLPAYCTISNQTDYRFQFECPLNYTVDGKQVKCKISFTDDTTIIQLMKQFVILDFKLPLNQQIMDGIISTLQTIRLCNGVPADGKLPKTFTVENVSSLQTNTPVNKIGRSDKCRNILAFHGKTNTCTTCLDSYNQFKRRSSQKLSDVAPNKKPLVDITNTHNTEYSNTPSTDRAPIDISKSENAENTTGGDTCLTDHQTISLSPESHEVMNIILDILDNGNLGEFKLLLESQLKNNKSSMDHRHRRWDPKVISLCLGILLHSPQAYHTLKDSKLLTLPSRRTLQYYKNVVKQKPGLNKENLKWMKSQAESINLSEFGHHVGLLIDEMTIQDDLVITKQGDSWNVVGLIDMGETNNSIRVLTCGKKKVEMATHALQYVFHGFTGFRWPVVYFGSSTATAHELYTTFWDCVDQLDEVGFTVDYLMLDGASTNRSFMRMLMDNPRSKSYMFPDVFSQSHTICAIQDIMHVLKKLRNNGESSKSSNISKSGRYLVLAGKSIIWDHWREAFEFNFQSGFSIHRKLTEEHILLTPASKMRNHLAVEVLNSDMLFLMKSYQKTLANKDRLASSVHTSVLTSVFCDHNRPVSSVNDERLTLLINSVEFFNRWETEILNSNTYTGKKNLMTEETRDDLNSAVVGFLSLCSIHVKEGNSINPGYLNSDLTENFFCQQRGIRNGLNTNPTLAQYGPSQTAIILSQQSISNTANSGSATTMYKAHKPCPLNPQRNKSEKKLKRRSICI